MKIYIISLITCMILINTMNCNNYEFGQSIEQYDLKLIKESIEQVEIIPVEESNLDGEYQVLITFNEKISNEELPKAFGVCGLDGEIAYKRSDRLFALTTNNQKIRNMYKEGLTTSKEKMPGGSIGCSISFTKPGEKDENCGETCSETALLGGETLFCICIYDCEFEFNW